MNKRISLALLAVALAACSTPYHPPQFLDPGTSFPGLIDLAAQSQGKAVDVLLVHGICTHDERWAHDTVAQLAQSLAGVLMDWHSANRLAFAPIFRQAGQGGDGGLPEPAVAQPQIEPDDEGEQAEKQHHLRYPASRNQATASASPSTAGRYL